MRFDFRFFICLVKSVFFFLKTCDYVNVARKMGVNINSCFKITSHVIQRKERGLDQKDWHKKKSS